MTAVLVSLGLSQPRADAATLLLRYHFDESSSGSAPAEDAGSGTPAPGTFVGGATRTANTPAGFSTGALDLTAPGAGTYVDGGDATKLDPQESFTLTAWINLQGTPSGNLRIMSKQGGSTFPGFSWNIADPLSESGPRSAANFGLRLFVGGSNGFLFDPAPSGLSIDADNKWAFIAVTYAGDLSDANVNYYVGSADRKVQLASTTTINAGVVLDSSAKFGIGYTDAAPAADTAPPGFLDDVRVYAGTLSTQELEAVRQANIPEPSTAGLLLAGVLAGAGLGRTRITRQLE
jgi:hypothetical protein